MDSLRLPSTLRLARLLTVAGPTTTIPLPLTQEAADAFEHMKDFYDYMLAHKKMEIEKFCLGETNQIA